jgi:xanthosine phosphorylase
MHTQASVYLKQHPDYPAHFVPSVGIVVGSGLQKLVGRLSRTVSFAYNTLPEFGMSCVAGHANRLTLGYWDDWLPVVCLEGRVHAYEGSDFASQRAFIRTLKALGVSLCIITNATGSLRPDWHPGDLSVITDHINVRGNNPLIGPNDDTWGPRFVPMDHAYDPVHVSHMARIAQQHQIPLKQGVYVGVMGPVFETKAEITAFRIMGGDMVGMSTISEVIVANHCHLPVLALSVITNYGAGLIDGIIDHQQVLACGMKACDTVGWLIHHYLASVYVRSI